MDFPNMSYCACENTNHALNQILGMMGEAGSVDEFFEGLSHSEQRAFRAMLETMVEITGYAEDEGLI
jgi:hypothetical protein